MPIPRLQIAHWGVCPVRGEPTNIVIRLQAMTDEERIAYLRAYRRKHRREQIRPPDYKRVGFTCKYAASEACPHEDGWEDCPVYQEFHYHGYTD